MDNPFKGAIAVPLRNSLNVSKISIQSDKNEMAGSSNGIKVVKPGSTTNEQASEATAQIRPGKDAPDLQKELITDEQAIKKKKKRIITERRRQLNRESARRSRQKKKDNLKFLQDMENKLKVQTNMMSANLNHLYQAFVVNSNHHAMLRSQSASQENLLIHCLEQHRAVLDSLRSLREKVDEPEVKKKIDSVLEKLVSKEKDILESMKPIEYEQHNICNPIPNSTAVLETMKPSPLDYGSNLNPPPTHILPNMQPYIPLEHHHNFPNQSLEGLTNMSTIPHFPDMKDMPMFPHAAQPMPPQMMPGIPYYTHQHHQYPQYNPQYNPYATMPPQVMALPPQQQTNFIYPPSNNQYSPQIGNSLGTEFRRDAPPGV